MRLAVVGATGQAGSVMRQILAERDFPLDDIRFFASSRSAGTTLSFDGTDVVVEDAETADFRGIDIALSAAGNSFLLRTWADPNPKPLAICTKLGYVSS